MTKDKCLNLTPDGRPRARSLNIDFEGIPGGYNAITDIPGLEVGYETIVIDNDNSKIRTGVTAILPRGKDHADKFVQSGYFSLSGNGDITGSAWIDESGMLGLPIVLTNTFSVGVCHHAVIKWMNNRFPETLSDFGSPVVLETYDGILSDINAQAVTEEHVLAALNNAQNGPILEGSVGGGTGNTAFSFKAGTGTSSRVVPFGDTSYVVGVLVQANFGRRHELRLLGRKLDLKDEDVHENAGDGSCVIVIATDAPMGPLQCKALAKRAAIGIARTGSNARVTSGELFFALSTGGPGVEVSGVETAYRSIPWQDMTPFYDAVAWAVEEAIWNSMIANKDMEGYRGVCVPSFPHDLIKNKI